MYIKSLKVQSFKKFTGEHPEISFNTPNGERGSGLNIFVGENNTGKSTIFEAMDFLRNNTKKPIEEVKSRDSEGEVFVELSFQGDISNVIDNFSQPNKVETFKKYIFGDNDECIRLCRATPQNKAIKLWDNEDSQHKNESGIDAPVKKLFEANFVWADTNPNNELSFGTTTVCGNLLKEIANGFKETDDYQTFASNFHQTFNDDNSPLRQALQSIENRTEEIFQEQFGSAGIKFAFNELDISAFFKKADIEVDDGVSTSMQEKGSGMQRAIALAMLQVYAEQLTQHDDNHDLSKPFFLFIDEPEVCLHPKAQGKLLSALTEISKTKQVFVTTHSPYFLASPILDKFGVFIFRDGNDTVLVEKINEEEKLLPWSPTWGEINYKAYDLPTVEFHNELYGRLQELSGEGRINNFDNWLVDNGIVKDKVWTPERNGQARNNQDVTLQTFIRNKIHHPENTTMQGSEIQNNELKQSITQMISLLNTYQ